MRSETVTTMVARVLRRKDTDVNIAASSGGFANILDADLYYETSGNGQPIVLIHAGIADCRMWDAQWNAFTREHSVVRYDLRGFGQSTIPPVAFSHREDLAALLRVLGIPTCVLVGASFGGNVATEFAIAYPDAVGALILVNSLVGMREPSSGLRAGWAAVDAAVAAGDLNAGVEVELKMWVDGPRRAPDQVDGAVRERVRVMNTALFHRMEEQETADEQDFDPPARDRIGEIQAPTLVIVGEMDQPDALSSADTITSTVAGARKVTIPNAAHLPSMERPAEFNRIVLEFIDTL